LSTSCRCPYCQQWFTPSVYRPQQVICSQAKCQQRRRREYHRQKLANDAEYRQGARESQKKWRDAHPNYLREYRAKHPAAVTRNRQRQQVRDQKPRLAFLEKNNLALDLKRSVAKVWLVGPGVTDLAKNRVENALLMPEPLQVRLGNQGFGVSGSFAKCGLAWPFRIRRDHVPHSERRCAK